MRQERHIGRELSIRKQAERLIGQVKSIPEPPETYIGKVKAIPEQRSRYIREGRLIPGRQRRRLAVIVVAVELKVGPEVAELIAAAGEGEGITLFGDDGI